MADEEQKPILWDARELYKTRLVVFLETEPLSNKYSQVSFTRDQFIKLSQAISTLFPHVVSPGHVHPVINLEVSKKDPIALPENLSDWY